jgi:hypothetical protein
MKLTALPKYGTVILMMLGLVGGLTTTHQVSVNADARHMAHSGSDSASDLLAVTPPTKGIPLTFIENAGQFDARVRFQASNGNTTLFLTADALWMSLTDLPPQTEPVAEAKALDALAGASETGRQVNLKLSFVGANPHPRLEPFDDLDAKASFLTGSDPAKWRADVSVWAGVRYMELYPGIDLEVTGHHGQLTQRLVVRDPSALHSVSLRLEGADALAVEGDYLRLTTPLGDFALPLLIAEGVSPGLAPAIQVVEGAHQVSAPFASSQHASSVTPVSAGALLYSTYFGGSGEDQAFGIALDSAGDIFITGRTYSTNLPTTPGAYDISYGGGSYDAFVTKLSVDGSRLLYSTYLGGSDEDFGRGIAVDSAGNAYIAGHTYSADFPTTPGAADATLGGGRDAFVAKLNAAGDDLIFSTYLGGENWDYGSRLAIDEGGAAYVVGFTHGGFPVTPGAAQTVFGGLGDGFAAKLSPDGSAIAYGTYLGGPNWESIAGIAVDQAGQAYLSTGCNYADFPTTPGAYSRCSGNGDDAAVVKLSADGSSFVHGTAIGGADPSGGEWFEDVAVDSAGNTYLVGGSSAADFPTTPNALQRTSGGGTDVVVVKFNSDFSELLYSTYLGGSGEDVGLGIAIDGDGNAYITGRTTSTNLPTANPLQPANAGGYDAFVAVVNSDASTLGYSSYLGGSGDENRFNNSDGYADIAVDRAHHVVHVTGYTSSADFPTTPTAYDTSFNGGSHDAFVTGLSFAADMFTRITSGDIVNEGDYTSGACWGDYDGDGSFDLFVTRWGGRNNFLYHNNGDGTFEKITSGGIVNDGGWSRSCTWGDYDNDGFIDLAVSDDGAGIYLYHNEDGTAFSRVLDTPIAGDYGNCYGISWADYDNDGWLDLFVARHTNDNNLLYHNRGDGTFDRVATGAIVNDGGYSNPVSWGDYDADGCVDLFVGNVNDQANFLYHNNCDDTFTRITDGPIATDIGFSSTSNWVDYDNDGDLDLFVGNLYEDNFLYRNDGGGAFAKVTAGVIVTDGNTHNSSWADYDNDGDMDLFAAQPQSAQRLYQNSGDGSFTRITTGAIVEDSGASGGNWADYDNDGDMDLFVAVEGIDRHNALYRNNGAGNHWLHLRLIGAGARQARTATTTNTSAIGARVEVTAVVNGRTVQQMNEISGQTGMYNQNSSLAEFGLGDATIIHTVSVRWPSGVVQVLTNMAVDQVLTIREPRRQLLRYYLPSVTTSALSEEVFDITPGIALGVPRFWHTATLLADGRVMLIGGSWARDQYLAQVDIVDPVTGQTSRAAPLHTPRHDHFATLLQDGRVLVISGGTIGSQPAMDAEVYDPVTDTWTVIPPLLSHGDLLAAALMKDGRVLVVGGNRGGRNVEIFDPKTNTWTVARSWPAELGRVTAQPLDNGRVLVVSGIAPQDGGPAGKALLYDPQTDTWTATGPMTKPATDRQSVLLADGRVMVAGGKDLTSNPYPDYQVTGSVEIYDPVSNTWTVAADLAQPRLEFDLVLLHDGRVLAVDGARAGDCCWIEDILVREIELYDPASDQWRTIGTLPSPRAGSTATLLPDGRVWVTGGRTATTYFADTWLIGPQTLTPPPRLLVRYDFEGDFAASGTVLDRSGNGHDAQVQGPVSTAGGISGGQGISFDGGYLQAASNPAAGSTDVTFSLWFKTNNPTANHKLASGAWWNWGPGSGWIMATHIPEFWSDDGSSLYLPNQANNDNNFPASEWIHEVVTYDGSRIKEYTNGQLINDWATTGAPLGQGNPMVIGAWPPFTGYNFRGTMDEFRIYGRSLTQAEVQALYEMDR